MAVGCNASYFVVFSTDINSVQKVTDIVDCAGKRDHVQKIFETKAAHRKSMFQIYFSNNRELFCADCLELELTLAGAQDYVIPFLGERKRIGVGKRRQNIRQFSCGNRRGHF